MSQEKITALFDQHASTYDQKWSRLAPINGALHLLTHAVLSLLPADARILCVGAGTGAEILYLARQFPHWHFTAVDPSSAMLDVLRRRAGEEGISARCHLHVGLIETLSPDASFHAATAFLVSQFIQDDAARVAFFQHIARHLHPDGLLVSADLSADLTSASDLDLLEVWCRAMSGHGLSPEEIEKIRQAYRTDVAVRPPAEVQKIITQGGFELPVPFYQAGLIHACYARRRP